MNYINSCLDYHNKMYDKYKYNFQRSWPNENVVRFVKKYIKKKNNKILDIGCGTGRNVIFFLKEKQHVFGVDFSSSALNLLKKKIKNKNLKVIKDSIPYLRKINNKHNAAIDCFTSYCLKKKDFEKYLINIKKKK